MIRSYGHFLFLRILVTLPFSLIFNASGEPFLFPDDVFIRHEIRLIQDEASLNGLQNTWPLNLGGLSYSLQSKAEHDWKHSLLETKISDERNSGFGNVVSSLMIRDNRMISRGFSSAPYSTLSSNISTSWMNDRFAAKLSLNAFGGRQKDWKNRIDDGLGLDGSYISARLGNWSTTFGQVGRWWGPGWDGSLILSTNSRAIPSFSIDRRDPLSFETKWLSWLGPWSFHSFVGQLEQNRHISKPYIWGLRGEIAPTILNGLELGFFRVMQLGGAGRPSGLSTWVDAFLSQDNYGANTGNNDFSKEPGNQLAGIDLRWRPYDLPFAIYGQLVGEDEDKFLPNCLMFQYGIEGWGTIHESTFRVFAEFADLTSYWWTDDPRTRNITYGHHIYLDGYRHKGRPLGHWADQDSKMLSIGGFWLSENEIGWGSIIRNGKLNDDGVGRSSVSNNVSTDYFSFELFNSREYQNLSLSLYSAIGWESLSKSNGIIDEGMTAFLSLTRKF